jgi:hypothetical protein
MDVGISSNIIPSNHNKMNQRSIDNLEDYRDLEEAIEDDLKQIEGGMESIVSTLGFINKDLVYLRKDLERLKELNHNKYELGTIWIRR